MTSTGSVNLLNFEARNYASPCLNPVRQDVLHGSADTVTGSRAESVPLAANTPEIRQPDLKSALSVPATISPLINRHNAVELASRRIAQRLHDESAQMLAVVYLELAEIAKEKPTNLPERIKRVMSRLDDVKDQLRHISYELHPLVLDRYGLMPALHKMVDGMSSRWGLDISITGDELERLTPEKEVALYRCVQESLANVIKHAKANHVEVRLWKDWDTVICTVTDDGVGFPFNGEVNTACAGIGLMGIHERARSLQGSCTVLSRPGAGSTIKVEIPV